MASNFKWIGTLLVIMFASMGWVGFEPTITHKDYCRSGGVYGTWDNVSDLVFFNSSFPGIGKYYCEEEAVQTREQCASNNSISKGCEWCARVSSTKKTCYVIKDPPIPSGATVNGSRVHWEHVGFSRIETDNVAKGFGKYNVPATVKHYLANQSMKVAVSASEGALFNQEVTLLMNTDVVNTTLTYANLSQNYTCQSTNYSNTSTHFYCYDSSGNASDGNLVYSQEFISVDNDTVFWNEWLENGSDGGSYLSQAQVPLTLVNETVNGTEYHIAVFNATLDANHEFVWKLKSQLRRTEAGLTDSLKYNIINWRASDTLAEALAQGNYTELDPQLNSSYPHYFNVSYFNPVASDLFTIPDESSFNLTISGITPLPNNESLVIVDENNNTIPFELFNITQDSSGAMSAFTISIVLNFTANENKTLSFNYDVVPKPIIFEALDVSNISTDIIITNPGFYEVTLQKNIGGISFFEDRNAQQYNVGGAGGNYFLVRSASGANANMLGTSGAEVSDASCSIVENGTIRVKIQCKNTTTTNQQYYYMNFTFWRGSGIYEQKLGKTAAGDWAIQSLLGFSGTEFFINDTADFPLSAGAIIAIGADGISEDSFREYTGISPNAVNVTHLIIWEDAFTGYMQLGITTQWIMKMGVNAAQDSTTVAGSEGNRSRMYSGFIYEHQQTPQSNSSTFQESEPYFQWFQTPIQAAIQEQTEEAPPDEPDPPQIESIVVNHNLSCVFNEVLTSVEVNVSDADVIIDVLFVNISLFDEFDNNQRIDNQQNNTANLTSYNFIVSQTCDDVGDWNLTALVRDSNATGNQSNLTWNIPFGTLTVNLVNPPSNQSVVNGTSFLLPIFNASCDTECPGEVRIYPDP